MRTPIEFAKLSGSGNDFICLDGRDGRYDTLLAHPDRLRRFAATLCARGLAIGADGLIVACRPEIEQAAPIAARFFDPDGSEAELCGNGTACFVHWVIAAGWAPRGELKVLTSAGVVRGQHIDSPYVRVCIPRPEDLQRDIEITVKGSPWRMDYVVTGVPHVVTYVEDIDRLDVAHWGPGIRGHQRFAPRGVNVNFARVLGEGRLAVRTFEFGVEGETLACGTGSAAAAILTATRFAWDHKYLSGRQPVLVGARSGDTLRVSFIAADDGTVSDVCLETMVRFLYTGVVHPELVQRAMGE